MSARKMTDELLAAAVERRLAGETFTAIAKDLPISRGRLAQLIGVEMEKKRLLEEDPDGLWVLGARAVNAIILAFHWGHVNRTGPKVLTVGELASLVDRGILDDVRNCGDITVGDIEEWCRRHDYSEPIKCLAKG